MMSETRKSKDSDCSDTIADEEINFAYYLSVFRKQKLFILLAALLPTLLAALALYLQSRNYQLRYTYNMPLDEKNFCFLEDTFYSDENLKILTADLASAGFSEYAGKLQSASSRESLKQLIQLNVSPPFFEADNLSGNTNFEKLQTLQVVTGSYLTLRIDTQSLHAIWDIASLVRTNFEKQVPLMLIANSLNSEIFNLKNLSAKIINNRYMLSVQLKRKQSTLVKLKDSESVGDEKPPSNIVLQFDNIEATSDYLPAAYQIQAVETQIINLEEQIRTNQERLDYYNDLLDLYTRLYTHVSGVQSTGYTTEAYHVFLLSLLADYESKESVLDSLQAYTKQIEMLTAQSIPLLERPKIYASPKNTLPKTLIVFAVCLIAAVLAAFLRDAIQKSPHSHR